LRAHLLIFPSIVAIGISTATQAQTVTFTNMIECAGYAAMAEDRELSNQLLASSLETGLEIYEARHAATAYDAPGVVDDFGPTAEAAFAVGVGYVASQQSVLDVANEDPDYNTASERRQIRVDIAQRLFSEARCDRFSDG